MQYILEEHEYRELLADAEKGRKADHDRDTVFDACRKIANELPIVSPYTDEGDAPEPWGCIADVQDHEHYCDHCPVESHCTYPYQRFSQ